MANYWVVGAMLGGEDDQFEKFIKRGYWRRRFNDNDDPQAKLLDQIRAGDRIAIKRMLGAASPNIEIRAIGVVKDIGSDRTVYVDWLVPKMERIVPSHGFFASIHGPFLPSDESTKEIFTI